MLTELLLKYTINLGAEWVLWILVLLGLANGLIMLERGVFFATRRVDIDTLRLGLEKSLKARDFDAAAKLLQGGNSMETRAVLFALREWERGDSAVHELLSGAMATERNRYDRFLGFLGTVGNNAPFIGLFGTVLGIIAAFDTLGGSTEGSSEIMGLIAEALIATGVGLLVAIPAVIAFNLFKSALKKSVAQTELLGATLLAYIHEAPASASDDESEDLGTV